jgi:hypothetical protein
MVTVSCPCDPQVGDFAQGTTCIYVAILSSVDRQHIHVSFISVDSTYFTILSPTAAEYGSSWIFFPRKSSQIRLTDKHSWDFFFNFALNISFLAWNLFFGSLTMAKIFFFSLIIFNTRVNQMHNHFVCASASPGARLARYFVIQI